MPTLTDHPPRLLRSSPAPAGPARDGWLARLGRALSRVPTLPDDAFALDDRLAALSRLSSRPESFCTSGAWECSRAVVERHAA